MSPIASTVTPVVTQQVYVRHARTAGIALNGERDGYVLDTRLRCDQINLQPGIRVATASITYVPGLGDPQSFDQILERYSPDDQVMVVVQPIIDELQEQPVRDDAQPQDIAGRVMFEGVLMRHVTTIQTSPQQDFETVQWQAYALPWAIDNRLSDHFVAGRVVPVENYDAAAPEVMYIESHVLPAVFNFRGRPNRHVSAVAMVPADAAALAGITAPVFTHDDDRTGRYWTVRDALQHILVAIYGYFPTRTLCAEEATLKGIFPQLNEGGEPSTDPRFAGLDAQLPELSIHGLHVLNAIDVICRAAGLMFDLSHHGEHIVPPPAEEDLPGEGEESAEDEVVSYIDRPYVLRIYRKGSGPQVTLDLATRGSTFASAEAVTADNSISRGQFMRDATPVENEVFAQGMSLIEASFELLPLWKPADMSDDELGASLQAQPTDEQLAGDGYFARHTSKGSKFGQYAHVGRRWGLACLPDFDGYTAEDVPLYVQDETGYDFLSALGINELYAGPENTTGLYSAISAERAAAGVTEPARWIKRKRLALPLKSIESRLMGRPLILEVSEDGGATWQLCPVQFRTITDDFGLMLNLDNLAAVNQAQLTGGPSPAPEDSWWGLIQEGQLFFRLTCAIECDHGGRADLFRRASSGSMYHIGGLLPLDVEEVWRHCQLHYWPLQERTKARHVKLAGDQPIIPEEQSDPTVVSSAVRDAAVSYQASREDVPVIGSVVCPIIELDRYQLGQQVTAIRGRNFSLATSSGDAQRYPTIISVVYRLGGTGQGITLTLDDKSISPN